MRADLADVFFAQSAEDVFETRAAFGCTHLARAFVALSRVLGIVAVPQDLRYCVSCVAEDYNVALSRKDQRRTINGHQFAMAKIEGRWVAINTSKAEYVLMPLEFSPDKCVPPSNIAVVFPSYGNTVFLLRRIGKNFDDDCGDCTLDALMNISRSGSVEQPSFLWAPFDGVGPR
jgi:hypothetical protein